MAAALPLPPKIARLLALARSACDRQTPLSDEEAAEHLRVCESAPREPRQANLFAPLGRASRPRRRAGGRHAR